MYDLTLKSGKVLSFDESKGIVLVDGKPSSNWLPSFIPNGDDEPDFFGYISKSDKKCYDIYGGVSNIVEEDAIKL